jgi:hypothetical protein
MQCHKINKTRTKKECQHCKKTIDTGSVAVRLEHREARYMKGFEEAQTGIWYDREYYHFDCRPFYCFPDY